MENIKIIKNPSPNWGGARPGGGRKPTGRVRKVLYVTEDEFSKIKAFLQKLRG